MTQLTIQQIADAWIAANGYGGDMMVNAVAVALAESDGWTTAVSPSDDYGVWQINSVHASSFPHLWPLRFHAYENAKMAVAISNRGQNWGPWCTAWADPANCGHYLGTILERGSPAASHLAHVSAVLGEAVPVEHFPPGFGNSPEEDAWARIQHIMGPGGKSWHDQVSNAVHYMERYAR